MSEFNIYIEPSESTKQRNWWYRQCVRRHDFTQAVDMCCLLFVCLFVCFFVCLFACLLACLLFCLYISPGFTRLCRFCTGFYSLSMFSAGLCRHITFCVGFWWFFIGLHRLIWVAQGSYANMLIVGASLLISRLMVCFWTSIGSEAKLRDAIRAESFL